MSVEPFPFATIEDLKKRWKNFPDGEEDAIDVHLEDASQFILDMVPAAARAHERTRRRVVCQVVKRYLGAEDDEDELRGMESVQLGTGPFQDTFKPANPHGGYYLTKQEMRQLGNRRQRAFSVDPLAVLDAPQS